MSLENKISSINDKANKIKLSLANLDLEKEIIKQKELDTINELNDIYSNLIITSIELPEFNNLDNVGIISSNFPAYKVISVMVSFLEFTIYLITPISILDKNGDIYISLGEKQSGWVTLGSNATNSDSKLETLSAKIGSELTFRLMRKDDKHILLDIENFNETLITDSIHSSTDKSKEVLLKYLKESLILKGEVEVFKGRNVEIDPKIFETILDRMIELSTLFVHDINNKDYVMLEDSTDKNEIKELGIAISLNKAVTNSNKLENELLKKSNKKEPNQQKI